MKRVEEFLATEQPHITWSSLFYAPTCIELEPRYHKVFDEEGMTTDGSFYTRDGLLIAGFFNGDIFGLESWGGSSLLEGQTMLVKNPEVYTGVRRLRKFGEMNGIALIDGYLFAMELHIQGGRIVRPVRGSFQPALTARFTGALSALQRNSITPYPENMSRSPLPNYAIRVA